VYTPAPASAKAYAQEFKFFVIRNERFCNKDGAPTESKKLSAHFDDFMVAVNAEWWTSHDSSEDSKDFSLPHHCKRDNSCCPGRTDAERRAYMDMGRRLGPWRQACVIVICLVS
jgi:hypothetical protein